MENKEGIAIVGMDCRYPGAHGIQEYWENIISLRQQFRRVPDKRLNLDYYGSEDTSSIDHTYSKKAAVLAGYQFDRVKYRVSKSTFEQTDMTHWLALDVAAGALKDAGFENGADLDKSRVGVILGNSLTGEFTRASVMRLRWPYVFKVMESTLSNLNYDKSEIAKILESTEKVYKSPFPAPDADTLAGGLSNTIAGRICNYFDFNGGGYTIDGACSSSLLAFTNGCNAIRNGDLEVALVGGVDLSIDPFEVIGFARNGALAAGEMEVYGTKSQGFWPGEGCGIAVLMKESEAIARGLTIYGVIRGWGISSDGKGGITRPKPETQQLAMERAYAMAGYDPASIAMFEGHGTGTPLGDQVEMTALVNALRKSNKNENPAVLGSVKHLIGHTKAAAGIAGVIKAGLALKNGLIPASRSNFVPHQLLQENADVITLGNTPQLWQQDQPMRASVSSMGFGGINVHLTIEGIPNGRKSRKVSNKIDKISRSWQDVEIFPISANTKKSFLQKLQRLQDLARDISRSEFIDLASTICATFQDSGVWKATFIASTPDQLLENIVDLREVVNLGANKLTDSEKGIFFGASQDIGKIGFLFPGQGSPVYTNFGAFMQISKDICLQNTCLQHIDSTMVDTSIVQPAIVKNSLQSVELLSHFGIDATYAIGHSLGEISALSWAEAIDQNEAVAVAMARGATMSQYGEQGGAMLALNCDQETLQNLITDQEVAITGYNGENNYVIGGLQEAIDAVERKAFEKEIQNTRLKVSHAFHTPMMKKAAKEFKKFLQKNGNFAKPKNEVISTVTGDTLDRNADLKTYLFDQIENPVRFTQAVAKIKDEVDFLIEVGPGKALTKALQGYKKLNVLALDFGSDSLRGFFNVLSAAYTSGHKIHFEELSTNRFYREFDVENWNLDVLVNPCEKLEYSSSLIQKVLSSKQTTAKTDEVTSNLDIPGEKLVASPEGIQNYIKKLISDKTEIPEEVITDQDKIMSQLHLNSLAITEIVSLVAKAFNRSHKVFSAASILANADGTIEALSKLIHEGESGGVNTLNDEKIDLEKLHNWTHIFKRKDVKKKASKIAVDQEVGTIKIKDVTGVASDWETLVNKQRLPVGNGAIYIYAPDQASEVLNDFISFLNMPEVVQGDFVVLVAITSEGISGDLKPVFRSFCQETPQITAFSLTLDASLDKKPALLMDELKVLSKYKEIGYTKDGERTASECEVYFPQKGEITEVIKEGDVILATGGGKGITFESIFELAITTQAKLAIMGRSKAEEDEVLAKNLQILTESNIDYRYYSVDVCDEKKVREVVQQVYTDLGEIQVILHGAGINNPKRIGNLMPADFEKTLSVKLLGLKNVMQAVDIRKLNVLVGYGSIIAQSGMQGNADYAWANDQMALYIQELGAKYKNCRCITLEWSVWDGTGMGVSLNSIDTLKEQGVWPVPIQQGIHILKAIIADVNSTDEGRYIISGRFGKIPTLTYTKNRLPLGRFISKIKYHVPQVEVISDVAVNLKDDAYLKNHVFNGQYVFPAVMILEGMAQCCKVLDQEGRSFFGFENLKINKSIFIPKTGSNTLRFVVTRISKDSYQAVVQSEDSDFEINCFEATINFGASPSFEATPYQQEEVTELDFDVQERFYDDLLFHHGPFRRITDFIEIHALSSLAKATTNATDKWYGPFVPEDTILGDPGLNDAAIHCHQASRPAQQLLPTAAKGIYINSKTIEGPLYIKTSEIKEEGNETIIDVCISNAKGEVQQVWEELTLTKVSGVEQNGHWTPGLLVPYLEYHLNKVVDAPVQLSIKQCEDLISSLLSKGVSEIHEVDGFVISLQIEKEGTTKKHKLNGSAILNSLININTIEQKGRLQIRQVNKVNV